MTYEAIGRLTLFQWVEIEEHERDRDGNIEQVPMAGGESMEAPESDEESFRRMLRVKGLPEWFIDRRWRACAGAYAGRAVVRGNQ